MSIPKFAARRDENEPEIIEALRAAGWSVQQINEPGFPDLVVARGQRVFLMEVIGDAKAKKYPHGLTPTQVQFHRAWQGMIHLVRSVDDALDALRWTG